MTIEDLKPGVSIRYKNEHEGGGEFIVTEIKHGYVWMIYALNEKIPGINGQVYGEVLEIVLESYCLV